MTLIDLLIIALVGGACGALYRYRQILLHRRARIGALAITFGLLVGGALGLPIGLLVHLPPNLRVQRLLGGSALAVVILSWLLAIR